MNSLFKKIMAIIVAIVILMVSSVFFQVLKAMVDNGLGQKVYDSFGAIGTFGVTLLTFLPLIVGIWLIKKSWKKITVEKVQYSEVK